MEKKDRRELRNCKFILVKHVCIDCNEQEGQLWTEDNKHYCVRCYAKRFGEVTVKIDSE